MGLDTAEFIRRAQAGDVAGFAALFEGYKNLVHRTAYLILNDTEQADEALQEVFVQVYRTLSRYDPAKGAFTTWLYRLTTNYCLNQRRKKRFSLVPLEWVQQNNQKASISLESRLDEDQAVQQALQGLSEGLRAAIVLRYYGELSYSEIAESLEIPIGTVKSRLNLGLKILRQHLRGSDLDWLAKEQEVQK